MLDRTGNLGRKVTLVETIVQEFLRLVEEGAVRPGDRIPPESELAETWGVGRSSVREAFRVFQLLGVTESAPGRGTYLANTAPLMLITDWSRYSEVKSVSGIIEARFVLESGTVRLAAERATDEDLARLQEAVDRGRAALGNAEASIQASLDFHMAVAEAAHNETLLLVSRLLRAFYYESTRLSRRDPESYQVLLRDHEAILQAVRARDPERAADLMIDHFRHGTRFIVATSEGTPAAGDEGVAGSPGDQGPSCC